MKQIKRLELATSDDPFEIAQRGLIRHVTLSEEDFRELKRTRPDLIVVDGDCFLFGQPHEGEIVLHYAFPDRDAFSRRFPTMFERLAPALEHTETPLGIRIRLTDRSNRPYLEPVLIQQAFELSREWMEMRLLELPEDAVSDQIVTGFRLRAAHPDDAEAIVEIEDAAIPMTTLTPEIVRTTLQQPQLFQVLEDSSTGRAIAFLRLRAASAARGHISDIAVHPQYQRQGLGEAMMRWAFAYFRSEGRRSARLRVNADNAPAIALYRKLGFTPGEMGFDYYRPIDEDEVRQVLEKRRGSLIRLRRRV